MNRALKKAIFAVLCIGVLTGTAWAGMKFVQPVTINTTYSYAYGSMGSARASSDSNQQIGCTTYNSGGTNNYGYCSARDASGNYKSCSWSGSQWTSTINAMTSASWIWFYWDASGNCTFITLQNDSSQLPSTP
jgi:hypothetical protein